MMLDLTSMSLKERKRLLEDLRDMGVQWINEKKVGYDAVCTDVILRDADYLGIANVSNYNKVGYYVCWGEFPQEGKFIKLSTFLDILS